MKKNLRKPDFWRDKAAVSCANASTEGKCGRGAGVFGLAFAPAALRLV